MSKVSKLRETLEITSKEASPAIYLTGSWQLFLQKSQSVLSANWACVSTAEIKRLQLPTEMSSPGTAVEHKSKGPGTQTSRSWPTPPPTATTSSVQKQSLALTAVCVLYTFSGKLDQNQQRTNNWVLTLDFKYLPIICPFAPLHKRFNLPAAPLQSKMLGSDPPNHASEARGPLTASTCESAGGLGAKPLATARLHRVRLRAAEARINRNGSFIIIPSLFQDFSCWSF